ncbi:hypothetical protein ROLI_010370 [Roseobacter fucihabitans]|uniref:Phospholipase A2 n=1 Tax=Roseobacter fucihabitans TaxID=1537242 RepID=A0ABZ2BQ30_9RHOB|nr:hypothetical protein [Roseobacter litoralis]MBC6965336.1 hypothetical protein [Roseobacter litoralis]MBC6965498.1 hypothetical protein [Roseobacter litoralis]
MKALSALVVMAVVIAVPGALAQGAPGLAERIGLPAHEALMQQTINANPAPFETDGCSGGMSGIWTATANRFPQWAKNQGEKPPWEACCIAHDRIYHDADGATEPRQSFAARLRADQTLRACVIAQGRRDRDTLAQTYATSGQTVDRIYDAIAQAMYLAVRLGGRPCSALPWRWGYGFADCSILSRFDTPSDGKDTED